MKRCPKCNCGAEFTNRVEYYAKQTGAFTVGLTAGGVASIFVRNHGAHVAHEIYKGLSKNIPKHYKCTNSACNYEWDESD